MKISQILYDAVKKLEGVMVPGVHAGDFGEALSSVRAVARALEISENKAEAKVREETVNENQA